jgi:retron-type reverse transcriptase
MVETRFIMRSKQRSYYQSSCKWDGMSVDELLTFLKENQKQLVQKLREGKYKPNPVRRVEIPKETKGEIRKLGVPTVVDQVFQQAITQELYKRLGKLFCTGRYETITK